MIENGRPDGGFVLVRGSFRVPFSLEFRNRAKLAISVHPDLRVRVVAPKGSSRQAVFERVEKRAGWIARQLRYFEQFQPAQPEPRFVSGETVTYLGRQYRLKTLEGTATRVKLLGRHFVVETPDPDDRATIRDQLETWFRDHAAGVFAARAERCLAAPALGLKAPPRLVIRKMSHRWGSCTRAGKVLLNPELIKAPVHCIDYVIMHELCHLKIHNHGKGFYRLLSQCMPDWEARKMRLESVVIRS